MTTAKIPEALKRAPFSLAEARHHGVTLDALRGSAWRRLGSELYCWSGLTASPWQVLTAWARVLPGDAVFAGQTAAFICGLDLPPTNPVEIALPAATPLRSRAGLAVRRCEVSATDVHIVRGLRATDLHFTLRELCATQPPIDSLIAIDMALRRRLTDPSALGLYAQAVKGRHGAARLRKLVDVTAPAESPMETRLRWMLLEAGLPRPEVQTNLHDAEGNFIARADLYYPAARLVIEYDGSTH